MRCDDAQYRLSSIATWSDYACEYVTRFASRTLIESALYARVDDHTHTNVIQTDRNRLCSLARLYFGSQERSQLYVLVEAVRVAESLHVDAGKRGAPQ